MSTDSPRLVTIGCNHHRTPLEVRERLALTSDNVNHLQESLKAHPDVREVAVLNTCNRIEVYAVSMNGTITDKVSHILGEIDGFPVDLFLEHAYNLENLESVQHAYRVASGLDSQMVGETQILGQMKSSYAHAVKEKTVGPILHRVFQKAFQAAKWARTETRIGTGQVSIGNVAVELATRIFGRLTVSRTMVIGSGEVGREVAKALRSRGVACMSIASRTTERANELAREVDGLVIPFSTWMESLPYVDIGIFATGAKEPLLDKDKITATLGKRPRRPLFLIDLSLPRNIDPSCAELDNVYLYNLEDLTDIANENMLARKREVEDCLKQLEVKAKYLWDRLKL